MDDADHEHEELCVADLVQQAVITDAESRLRRGEVKSEVAGVAVLGPDADNVSDERAGGCPVQSRHPSTWELRVVRVLHLPKNHLMLVAGIVWCAAGAMVSIVGLPLELRLAPSHLVLLPLAGTIFLAFYFLVFSRLVSKHTSRIRERTEDRLPFWNFFNASSWAVMALMMGGGMALRFSHLMPDWVIAFFYSGLGVALFLCGLRFMRVFARKDVLTLAPEAARSDS
jgi:hypothetical protein